MSPAIRRIVYVISYEIVAILMVTVGLSVLGFGGEKSGLVAIASSTVAVIWNYLWTTMFEAWEKRQPVKKRTVARRITHALGFEGGMIVFILPVVAWILEVSILEALFLEIGILVFFLIYTFVFLWVFDKVVPPNTTPKKGE